MTSSARAILRAGLPRRCVVVLAFHRIGDALPPWHFGTPPAQLRAVVELFASTCRPVPVAELDPATVRERQLVVTFDDGFADNLHLAAPLLEELGVPAAFFLSSELVGEGLPWPEEAYARLAELPQADARALAAELAPERAPLTPLDAAHAVVHALKTLPPDERDAVIAGLPAWTESPGSLLTWDEARDLARRGFEIGSHGATHAVLPGVDDDRLAAELAGSRRRIADEVGRCISIAYPDNRFDARVLAGAADAGFTIGFGGPQAANPPQAAPLALARISGEDPRVAAIALRAVRRAPKEFSGQVSTYVAERGTEFGFTTQAALVERLLVEPGDVLDAGCGTGTLARTLEAAGATSITGVDSEPAMVEAARRSRPSNEWLVAGIEALPFEDARFDSAVSLGVLEYVGDVGAAVRELARVVRPGGQVVVSVPQAGSPNALAYRLYESIRPGSADPGRPLAERRLVTELARAGLVVDAVRATNFFAFPFTTLAPAASARLARTLERFAGRRRPMRRLGSQLVVHARKPDGVVWLAPALPPGSTFLLRELAALQALGAGVRPAAPSFDPTAAAAAFARHPIRALAALAALLALKAPLDTERGRRGYVALWLKGLASSTKARGAHLHAVFADGVGTAAYVASRVEDVPYSFTAHAPYSLWQSSALLAAQARRARFVACVSEDIAARIEALEPSARTVVVRCPAPPPGPHAGDSGPLFVAVGTLIPHKGFATAVEAAALARETVPDVRLVLVGDGPEREALTELVRRLDAPVELRGALPNDDVLELLQRARGLLAPSEVQPDGDRDGLPVSILDAAAVGVPAIATRVSGIPEFVRDGATGILVAERAAPELAAAIVELARDPGLARTLGENARALAVVQHDAATEAAKLLAGWRGTPIV